MPLLDTITFEDPNETGARGKSQIILEQLQENPGQWAHVSTSSRTGGAAALLATLRKYGCEITSRSQPDGTSKGFARWPEFTLSHR